MNDDWRVQVTCPSTATAASLSEALREGELEHDLQDAAGERVVVSDDGNELFLYAGTRPQAERAADAVKAFMTKSNLSVRTELRRWHPVSEEWVDADLPMPDSERATAAEHAELMAQEDAEQARLKYAEWEVRVDTGSHRETLTLAHALRADGIPYLRRWRYLVIGAADEDAANALAARVRGIAPSDAEVRVEASAKTVEDEMPANPFSVFGGLGG
jgi:hypothetical protein